MKEVSIIINGVRYDAVDVPKASKDIVFTCDICDLHEHCSELAKATQGATFYICALEFGDDKFFKKSDKKFGR